MTEILEFDRVLSVCMDRVRGGDTVEACLRSYPSHAEQLEPLLQVATMLRVSVSPTMSSEGFAACEGRLQARAAELRAQHSGAATARRRARSGLLASAYRLIAATVAGVLLLCVLLSAGTVSAASTSLPGSPLYPVKRASEAVVTSVALTPQLQTRVHLAWANRRLREVEALLERDGVTDDAVLLDLEQETEQALAAAEQAGVESLTAAAVHTEHQQEVLRRVLDKAPPAARPGLERALDASAQGNERARSALEKSGGQGPPITPPGKADDKKVPKSKRETPSAVETPSAGDTSETPASTPQVQDELQPPGRGQGEVEDPNRGQGQGQGQSGDKADDPGRGQGQGHGPDKEEPGPPDKDKGTKPDPPRGEDPGKGQADEKHDKPDNPGQGKDKDK